MPDTEKEIRKLAIQNAVHHDGKAEAKSVLGKILADNPELRSRLFEIKDKIEKEVEEVNRLTLKKQKDEYEKAGIVRTKRTAEKKELPDLELSREGFVMRFAPNPDGALHIGNARPAVLNDEYVKKYNGRLILRFDDTDPKVKTPEKQFYSWIREDIRWLKIKVHKEVMASKRLPIYYKHAEMLIKDGGAYVCTCGEEWKKLRDKCKVCECRKMPKESQLRRWKRMLAANTGRGFREGEAVLRVKTDMQDKNPAVRDWAAFRIVDNPKHPFSKKKLWPLYNFASAIDDHLLGITHIMRGQEHTTNEAKQRYLYSYFRWKYPITSIVGRFSMSDMVLSKSTIREGIRNGTYEGWDDVKIGTIRSLRRRGFVPEAIRGIIKEIGPKPSDITISMENLSSFNRKLIDAAAKRYFFIVDPKKIEVTGLKAKTASIRVHPDSEQRRSFSLGKHFFVDSDDFNNYKGLEVRLKDLCNVKLGEISAVTSTEKKNIPKIHWLPSKYIEVRVLTPEKMIKGFGEMNLLKAKEGDIVQFERFGFCRIEKIGKNNIVAVFGHK